MDNKTLLLFLNKFSCCEYSWSPPTGFRSDAWESISFTLDDAADITKLYSMIPVWMTSTFIQGHRATIELEGVQSFRC